MQKKIISFLSIIFFVTLSCERQTVYEPELLTATIPIVISWANSSVDESNINNVSAYFYPEDGSAPTIVYSGDPYLVTASLTEGVYDIIVHNEIEGNITGVNCYGSDSALGYQMMTIADDESKYDMFYEAGDNYQLIKESEAVGAWRYDGFEVSKDLIAYTRTRSFDEIIIDLRSKSQSSSTKVEDSNISELLTKSLSESLSNIDDIETKSVTKSLDDLNGISPTPLTSTYTINIEVDNLNNIKYIEGVIDGFVDGVNVFSGEKIDLSQDSTNYTYFEMTDYYFDDGSTTDGVMTYTFTNFGHMLDIDSGVTYTLEINIILQSGELYTTSVDITSQVLDYVVGVSINININIGDSYENGTPTVVLPENAGAGFGVGAWGDAENVELG